MRASRRSTRVPEAFQGRAEQDRVLVAVAAAPGVDELALDVGQVDADARPEQDVEVLERDGGQVGAMDLGEGAAAAGAPMRSRYASRSSRSTPHWSVTARRPRRRGAGRAWSRGSRGALAGAYPWNRSKNAWTVVRSTVSAANARSRRDFRQSEVRSARASGYRRRMTTIDALVDEGPLRPTSPGPRSTSASLDRLRDRRTLPLWVIFTKAGEAGWQAIIPIWNTLVAAQDRRKADVVDPAVLGPDPRPRPVHPRSERPVDVVRARCRIHGGPVLPRPDLRCTSSRSTRAATRAPAATAAPVGYATA